MQTETKQKMVLGSINFLNTLKGLPPTITSSLNSWILDETILSLMSVETTQKIASIETTTICLQTADEDISMLKTERQAQQSRASKITNPTFESNPTNNNVTMKTTPLTGK